MADKIVRKKNDNGIGYTWDFNSIGRKEVSTKATGYKVSSTTEEKVEEVKPKRTRAKKK